MSSTNRTRWWGGVLAVCGLLALTAGGASAQTTTGTIRGHVTDSTGAAVSGADVAATNTQTGVVRHATTKPDGSYILVGLVPATYQLQVRRIGASPVTRTVVVEIGAVHIVNVTIQSQAVRLAGIEVTARASAPETRTSEVATVVSPQQIQQLPTPSRNFLDLAALAPGVSVTSDRVNAIGFRTFSGGASSADASNVYIDGTSFKNDLTGGGVVGQDASRGNPFPRNAIQEYRVITQNYKAEYQNASSAIITATTRSGGNAWHGNAFYSYQNKGLVALDTFQIADSVTKPEYTRSLVGGSVGGPLIRDKLFFFGSFEGNYQNRSNRVNFTPPTGFAALDTVNLANYNGNFTSPFRESLFFGKVNWAIDDHSSAEFSVNDRHETDVRDFGGLNAYTEAINYRQNIAVVQAKYSRFWGAWLNEAKVDYSRFQRNPSPNQPGIQRIYQYSNTSNVIGANASTQNFIQKGLGLRDDLTYSGLNWVGQHVIKMGANVNFKRYDIYKGNDETPRFYYADTANTNLGPEAYAFQTPYQLIYGTGNAQLNTSNNEVGAYVQDDWSPTSQLTLNLGLRWDYESHMFNTNYVTPQNVVDTLTRYNDSLPTPLNLSDYISTGNNRSGFKGAFQPRLGFSYALDKENKTTIFGGWGLYYDRSGFDVSVDETLKLTHPTYTIMFAPPGQPPGPGQVAWNGSYLTGDKATLDNLVHTQGQPEAWLIANNPKVPHSQQFSLGVRQALGTFLVTATYQGVRGYDLLTLNWANFGLNPDGSCCTSFNLGAHGFSNFIYSTNQGKTWYDAGTLQIQRAYRPASNGLGWGAGLAFTYAKRSVSGVDNLGDEFSFPNATGIPKHPSNDERVHIVANWIMDMPYLYGIQFSGLITLGSGAHQDVGCPARFCGNSYMPGAFTPPQYGFIVPGAFAYREVDVRLKKDFPAIAGTNFGVTLDVFNVFNFQNLGCFNTGSMTDPNYGKASCVVSDPRRMELGANYTF